MIQEKGMTSNTFKRKKDYSIDDGCEGCCYKHYALEMDNHLHKEKVRQIIEVLAKKSKVYERDIGEYDKMISATDLKMLLGLM
jgi:hypothetical protein